MNQDHVSELAQPGSVEREKLMGLIAKVIIDQDDRFTEEDIETARDLCEFQWKSMNVVDFLHVIAGHNQPGEPQDLAYGALVYPLK